MERSSQNTQENETDIIEIFFNILSQRWLIISTFMIFTLYGIIHINYREEIFKTNATLLISEEQSDASSFLNNNEYQFLYNNNVENEDQVSLFKSTLILNQVIERLGIDYKFYKKKTWKSNELLTKESLPFEIDFKKSIYKNNCFVRFSRESVTIEINDKIFSFSTNESKFENSIFVYKPKFLNYESQETYIIKQFHKIQIIEELLSNYVVNPSNKSNTYELSYSGPNKDLNSTILKGIVHEITKNNTTEKKNVYKLSINFINLRITKLEKKIDSINLLISNFKISNRVYMPEIQTNSTLTNLNEIEQEIFNNSLQSELSVKLLNELKKQKTSKFLPTDFGIKNVNINRMVSEFNKVIIEKNNLLADATEKNPLVVQSLNQLNNLKSNILNSLNIYINKLKTKSKIYNKYKQKNNSLVGVIPLRESELGNLERDILLVNNLHSYLSQKKEEAMISLSSLESNIKLINEVDYILESKTSKSKTLAIFSFAGFILPVGFSYCLFLVRSLYVDIEFLKENLSNINFLGIVKHTKNNLSIENKSIQYEFLRRIHHNINMLTPQTEKGRSIMITSCYQNEGKTYTAFNLSSFLAITNKKVALIGTDYRNPDLSELFDKKNMHFKGLTNIINDHKNNYKELFEEYKINNNQLDTLFVGTEANNKTSFFNNEKFDNLVSYLKDKYDYIIFDTAPILSVVDPLELLERSDYVVHVFRKNFSPKKSVNYVLDYIEKYKPKNIGYVITDDSKPDKLIDKYGYGYGYGTK